MLAALAPGSFPRGAARGNTIRRIAVVHRIPIERQRIVLADLRVEIHSPTVRQGHDNRSAGRAATCRALATVVQAIVAEALVAVATMVSVATTGSAAEGQEAERTG